MDILQYRENKKFSVLLVEDEEILTKIYVNVIAREGYRVLASKTGKSALNKFNEHDVNIILLDLMLPDISGLDVLKQVRKSNKDVKVIVLTNMLNSEVMREISSLGVNGYLSKSDYTPDQIVSTIQRALYSNKTFSITN